MQGKYYWNHLWLNICPISIHFSPLTLVSRDMQYHKIKSACAKDEDTWYWLSALTVTTQMAPSKLFNHWERQVAALVNGQHYLVLYDKVICKQEGVDSWYRRWGYFWQIQRRLRTAHLPIPPILHCFRKKLLLPNSSSESSSLSLLSLASLCQAPAGELVKTSSVLHCSHDAFCR